MKLVNGKKKKKYKKYNNNNNNKNIATYLPHIRARLCDKW